MILKREKIMAGGWTRDGGVQDQIEASVADAVKLARSRLRDGVGLAHCAECEAVIPEARRKAIPGVRLCVACQSELEKRQTMPSGFNRRGSKDSQLR
jgi:phage/conjugal plasmid C-4 type zinc finger TraR family protein